MATENKTPEYTPMPFVIRCNDEYVGFLMVGFEDGEDIDAGEEIYWMCKFMIDNSHQNKGYGKLAMTELIKYLRTNPMGRKVNKIYTAIVLGNIGADKLYTSVGFEKTGSMFGNEELMCMTF